MLRLFLDAQRLAMLVKLDHAKAFRVRDIIPEDRGPAILFRVRDRRLQQGTEPVPIENVVAQHHSAGFPAEELLTEDERLRKTVRTRLHLVGQADSELAAVAQQRFKARRIVWRADNQYLPDPGQHERGQRIVDHGFVIDREELL